MLLNETTQIKTETTTRVLYDTTHPQVKTVEFGLKCGLRGCKNRPAPFPGRMSYKATKP